MSSPFHHQPQVAPPQSLSASSTSAVMTAQTSRSRSSSSSILNGLARRQRSARNWPAAGRGSVLYCSSWRPWRLCSYSPGPGSCLASCGGKATQIGWSLGQKWTPSPMRYRPYFPDAPPHAYCALFCPKSGTQRVACSCCLPLVTAACIQHARNRFKEVCRQVAVDGFALFRQQHLSLKIG